MKPLNQTTAAEYFGSMVESYDAFIRRAVPRYEEMTARLVDYLPPSPRAIVELGCGTGNLSLQLAARFPDATSTFVDAAPEMIEAVRARLEQSSPDACARARFVVARFEDVEFSAGSVDLVTSSMSLHHVVDKAALYARIARWLSPGGALRFSDQLLGGSDANHALNWNRWLEHCRAPGNCSEEDVRELLDHAAAHDHYTPLVEHFRMLEAKGFVNVDCVWRNWIWGVVTADRNG